MRKFAHLAWLGVGCLVAMACAHPPTPIATFRPQCGRPVPNGCPQGPDDNLCPPRALMMESGCHLSPAVAGVETNDEAFRQVVVQMREEPRLTAVSVVVADPACGAMLRGRLESLGADPARIQVRPVAGRSARTIAYFEVASWNGTPCDPEVLRKVPVY